MNVGFLDEHSGPSEYRINIFQNTGTIYMENQTNGSRKEITKVSRRTRRRNKNFETNHEHYEGDDNDTLNSIGRKRGGNVPCTFVIREDSVRVEVNDETPLLCEGKEVTSQTLDLSTSTSRDIEMRVGNIGFKLKFWGDW